MALWIRTLKGFGLKLLWNGDCRVLIANENNEVIDVAETDNGSNDLETIGQLMQHLEDEMHYVATAMEHT